MWGKILIIDDDSATLELLRHILTSISDTEVVCEAESSRAVELIKENEFDLILTDIVMPEPDGLDILKLSKELWPDTEVVMLSGLIDLDRAIDSLKLHAFDFIEKPVKVEKLRATVENALEKKRLTRENQKMTLKLKEHNVQLQEKVQEATTELRNNLRKLELYSKNQQAILDNMPSGCVVLDTRGAISHMNSIAESILSIADSNNERSINLYNHPHLGKLSSILQQLAPSTPSIQSVTSITDEGSQKNLTIKVAASLVETSAGDSFIVAILEDITEVKRLEKEIREKERLATVGGLASGIAHELKNPLGAIRGLGELLSMKIAAVTKLQKFSDNIMTEVDRLNTIIVDIVRFSKETTPALQSVDFLSMLENLIVDSRQSYPEVTFHFSVEGEPPKLPYDFAHMKQALGNIIENAVLAIEDKSDGTVSVTVTSSETTVRIAITDNGIGMDENALGRVFKPFYSTRKAKGSGLGMTIAEKTVRDHRGHIKLQSVPLEGTTVMITLPLGEDIL